MKRSVAATVLLCSRERHEMLRDAIASVLAGDVVPAEILVIDQSRVPIAHPAPIVRVVHRPGRGLSRARNVGLAHATNELVAIVDDDMLVDPAWLKELVAGLHGTDDVATGRVLALVEPGRHRVPDASLVTATEPSVVDRVVPRDVVPGAGLVVRRGPVAAIGGYDERLGAGTAFGGAEDNDLGHRLLSSGCRVRHVPSAVAWHRGRTTRGGPLQTLFAYGTGSGAFYAKHVGTASIRRRLAHDTMVRLARAVRRSVPDPEGALGDLVFAAGVTTGCLRWWLTRQSRRPSRG